MSQLDARLLEELLEALPHLRRWASKTQFIGRDADDLVSDAVVSLLERPECYEPARGSLRNFLFACMKNKVSSIKKNYKRNYMEKFRANIDRQASAFSNSNPCARILESELRQKIDGHLESMPPKSAEAFKLFTLDGMGYAEIAGIMGVSRGSVRVAICRIRVRLLKCLEMDSLCA